MQLSTVIAVDFSDWVIPITAASLPAAASIAAAIVAARAARKSKAAELDAARIRDLEERLSERKYEVYRPMFDLIRQMLDSPKTGIQIGQRDTMEMLSEFGTWISIFGSDDALRAYHNFMQGAFKSAPGFVTLRLYADFVLAARRDMGDESSKATPIEVLGIRLKDLYDDPSHLETATLPFDELCERHEWTAPWS